MEPNIPHEYRLHRWIQDRLSDSEHRYDEMGGPILNKSDAHYMRSVSESMQGNWAEAIEFFKKATKLDHNHVLAYHDMGLAYLSFSDHERALRSFDNAIRLDPTYVDALVYRAFLSVAPDGYHKGTTEAYLSVALAIDPKCKKALEARLALRENGTGGAQAIGDLTTLMGLEPGNPQLYSRRGALYMKMGRTDDALADYTEAIRLDPETMHGYLERAKLWRIIGQHDKAEIDETHIRRIQNYSAGLMEGVVLKPSDQDQSS